MGFKEFLKPNFKKIIIAIIFFLLSSSVTLVIFIKLMSRGFSDSLFYILIFSLILSYLLSCLLVRNFSKDYLKKASLTHKLIISYLSIIILFRALSAPYDLPNYFSSPIFPEMIQFVILISLVFSLINIRGARFFSSIHFISVLFNPINFFYAYARQSYQGMWLESGTIVKIVYFFQESIEYNLTKTLNLTSTVNLIFEGLYCLFAIAIIIYLWLFLKRDLTKSKERIFFGIIFLLFLTRLAYHLWLLAFIPKEFLITLLILIGAHILVIIIFLILNYIFKEKNSKQIKQ